MSARSEVRERIRGLYGIADAGTSDDDPVGLGVAYLDGGCRLLQLRCKGWTSDERLRAARDLLPRCRAVGATLIVNDDAEVAAAADADGLHVGQSDGEVAALRRVIGPDRILGRSTGALEELLAAEADYLAFGPVFETVHRSAPAPARGLDHLRRARLLVTVPLVAIGGIGPANVEQVRSRGADSWAVIGAVALADDRLAAVRSLL